MDIIKVNYGDSPTVSAKELYEMLGFDKSQWSRWHTKNIEGDNFFKEGVDYIPLDMMSNGNHTKDFQITIDMAKEICMLARNEKGKQARQYFIQLEKDWNSPEKIMARALKLADKQIQSLTGQVEEMKPKALFADCVSTSNTSILVGDLAKILKQNKVDIGANRLFKWLRNNGYLIKRKGTDYNMPTQKSMELELFKIKETTISHSDGHISVSKTPKVTGKGQQYSINKFIKEKAGN